MNPAIHADLAVHDDKVWTGYGNQPARIIMPDRLDLDGEMVGPLAGNARNRPVREGALRHDDLGRACCP
ncbi:hypothetical protein [Paracoccus alkanivorans]|uniref:Uncharacterized protein n=1 Tax=Paracoccus alkanivorans TaxID=2116655 RepID=A0A3M0MAH9_9RHOB|nr:hypothetical protein [Paracoccus alkanivorans]RMC34732.1 hypothetical protein C9E81_11525 [Paracoccus alkanivorans]